ncbi:MAG: hypothetical protein IIZ47_03815 [Erysipelotrichaceae bacterium]|nr:hypothetical protein [Erysipelotrichaceae bacterium]
MFDLDKFLTSTTCEVNATDITFKDMRTGKTYRRTIYRPGSSVNFSRLGEEMSKYGYKLLNTGDPGNIPGKIDWSQIFGRFLQEEPAEEE